ncbi:hypothetical protein MGG_16144 [Pyricularia oryzae 70-15]|uniref:Uncharacterized protein n=4 Tax=Pyricularia oryzae TaxID=318829 RepID=G4MKP5_PYRO7|nr:uncharacterized protein MGG_16144 [Pyricularia oryzae 70-15]ELQ38619.1 hypothetical protein OOU_Y34scaffold00533g2 [Pyricularia oryzae Y34]KAI7921593.1 hypothetical protein M0657_006029 [Pyricularia oryzae]EHA56735.1 hypothetical protein MGG_16144 [Pyricularia oryzae 70-15]KAI7930180.1 hypothetical protein M9X92_000955 [Pyricularia oryzae]QBZ53942.1 hypothetical protein PoMZ_09632 [Pyricularia oryzae]
MCDVLGSKDAPGKSRGFDRLPVTWASKLIWAACIEGTDVGRNWLPAVILNVPGIVSLLFL